ALRLSSSLSTAAITSTTRCLRVPSISPRWHRGLPKLVATFVAGLQDAIEFIAANRAEAAQIYAETAKAKQPEAEILRIINDPDLHFTLVPTGIMKYANFMQRSLCSSSSPSPSPSWSESWPESWPESWKDVFVSELHDLPGN